MPHQCQCSDPGRCEYLLRDMSPEEFDICQNCFNNKPRASIVAQWYREKLRKLGHMAGCAFKGPQLMDEEGYPKFRRTCGCSGQKPQIYLFECFHPQPRTAEEECEKRCGDYTSL